MAQPKVSHRSDPLRQRAVKPDTDLAAKDSPASCRQAEVADGVPALAPNDGMRFVSEPVCCGRSSASNAAGWKASVKTSRSGAAAPTARLRSDAASGPPRLTLTFQQTTAVPFHPHHRPGPSRDERKASYDNNQDGRQDEYPLAGIDSANATPGCPGRMGIGSSAGAG
jgi:hypothetical protein